jgi:hypothetical protein
MEAVGVALIIEYFTPFFQFTQPEILDFPRLNDKTKNSKFKSSYLSLRQEKSTSYRILTIKGDDHMEQAATGKWICSACKSEIADYSEFVDNDGVCDECYSIPLKKRRGLVTR